MQVGKRGKDCGGREWGVGLGGRTESLVWAPEESSMNCEVHLTFCRIYARINDCDAIFLVACSAYKASSIRFLLHLDHNYQRKRDNRVLFPTTPIVLGITITFVLQ